MSETGCGHPAGRLLAWYANGSLEGRAAADVGVHVESCPSCAAQLDELLAVGRLVEDVGIPLLSEAEGHENRARTRPRSGLAYAAALAVPAALGIWWGLLGFPGMVPSPAENAPLAPAHGADSGPSAPGDLSRSAFFDLGGGAFRGPGDGRVFTAPLSVELVQIAFSVPVNPDARYRLLLRGPMGEILVHEEEHLPLDFDGTARYTIPASLLREPGAHVFVAVEMPPGRPPREYAFPFEIELPARR